MHARSRAEARMMRSGTVSRTVMNGRRCRMMAVIAAVVPMGGWIVVTATIDYRRARHDWLHNRRCRHNRLHNRRGRHDWLNDGSRLDVGGHGLNNCRGADGGRCRLNVGRSRLDVGVRRLDIG